MKLVKDRRLRAPTNVTLREEVEAFLAGVREGRILNKREEPYKPAVVRNYELSLRLRVLPVLGNRKLDGIDLSDLIELKEDLQVAGVSASTIRNTFVPLQSIYRRARLAQRVAVDPTIDLPLPTAGARDRAATPEQASQLLALVEGRERAILATAFHAALRRGELQALRVSDVDLEARLVRVERGWDQVEGPITPKSRAGVRAVFVLDVLELGRLEDLHR